MPISQRWHCLAVAELRWGLPETYLPCSQGACGRLLILRKFGIERAYGKGMPNISWTCDLRRRRSTNSIAGEPLMENESH